MLRSTLLAGAVFLVATGAALAGPQYVDETGFALSGYDPVAFFELEQSPLGERQPHAVPGRADITADWNDATWAFASAANRDRFLENPEAYAPAYDGHCAYGMAKGGKVPGNPHLWRIVDGTLYLNINPPVVGFWEADIDGNLGLSETNWQSLDTKAASTDSWIGLDANAGTYEVLAPIGG